MKSSKLTVTTIVIVTIGLVITPLAWKGLRVEIAHWYLAAGANAVELESGDGAREIEQAKLWYANLPELQDYWLLRVKQAKAISPAAMVDLVQNAPATEQANLAIHVANELIGLHAYQAAAESYKIAFGSAVLNNEDYWTLLAMDAYRSSAPAVVQVLREAMLQNSRFGALTLRFAMALASKLEFDSALEALHLALDESSTDPSVLNQFAYYRALARVELNQALEDINVALKINENEPALRDTRAWVLFQLGRPEEALADANFAVEATERFSPQVFLERWAGEFTTAPDYASLLPDDNLTSENKPPNKSKKGALKTSAKKSTAAEDPFLTMPTANPVLWNLGVLHYHRAKILEKLDRPADAKRDWDWIKQHKFPPDDRLH